MIICKCIDKIKDKNGIIVRYNLMDFDSNVWEVEKTELKEAIAHKRVLVTNLKLATDGKLVNRSVEEEAKLMARINTDRMSERDQRIEDKSSIIGILASDKNGMMYPTTYKADDKNITISTNVRRISGVSAPYTDVSIIGSHTIYPLDMRCKSLRVYNASLYKELLAFEVDASEGITLDTPDLNVKTIDYVFKYLKECHKYRGLAHPMFVNGKKLDKGECLKRERAILKRQKKASGNGRRMYDLIIYILFMHCMAISFQDLDFLVGIDEYKRELNSIEPVHSSINGDKDYMRAYESVAYSSGSWTWIYNQINRLKEGKKEGPIRW